MGRVSRGKAVGVRPLNSVVRRRESPVPSYAAQPQPARRVSTLLHRTMDFLLTYAVPVLAVLMWLAVLMLMRRRRLKARAKEPPQPFTRSVLDAVLSILIALPAACIVGYAVMFGPSYLTGDFIGLPWLTMFPALAIGGWVFTKVSKKISERVLKGGS